MRRLGRVLVLAGSAAVAIGGPAAAIPFGATLGFLPIGPGVGISPVFVSGGGSGTSQPLLVTVPGGVFAGSPSNGDAHLALTGNGPGSFTGSALAGALPLRGSFRVEAVHTFGGTTLVEVPLAIPVTNGYLGFGVGGTATLPVPGEPNAYWNIVHDSFGLGPRTVSTTYVYSFHDPVGPDASMVVRIPYVFSHMYTGTDSRTPGGLGQVTLVSPTKVERRLDGLPTMFGTFVLLGTLTLSFVPEPGTFVLLGAGVVSLALAGRARRRR